MLKQTGTSGLTAERFNTVTCLRFLKQLVRCYGDQKVFLVADNVRYNHALAVKDWLSDNEERIEVSYLPAYSPEFNAVELVWRRTKRLATHNIHFSKLEKLKEAVFRRFNRFQGNPASLRATVQSFAPVG